MIRSKFNNKPLKSGIDPNIFGLILSIIFVVNGIFQGWCASKGLPKVVPFEYTLTDFLFPWLMDQDKAMFVREVLAGNLGPYSWTDPIDQTKEDMYIEIAINKAINEILDDSFDEVGQELIEFCDMEQFFRDLAKEESLDNT